MKFSPLSLLLAALVLPVLPLAAQVLPELNYQGRVAVNGNAFTGTGQFRFALVADNGSVVWSSHATETTGIAVQNGQYSVRLGNTSLPNMAAVPSALFIEPGLRLRVWFNDGVNGLQQLAPDQFVTPVGYAHRASSAASADFIPASAIDEGTIQPSHLAKSLQTGTAGGLASIPAAGGVLSVTFPQPFETPPAVTLGGVDVPAANVSGTGFTLSIPPHNLLVDDGTPAGNDVGDYCDMILVGGFPAIAYHDATSGNLLYIRATNAAGSAWGTPVPVDVGGAADVGSWCTMAMVNGNPAIAYHDSTNRDVRYVRATTSTGSSWGSPAVVASGANDYGQGIVLQYINFSVGVFRPVIAYLDATNGTVRVKMGTDASGTAWGAQQTPDTSLNSLAPRLGNACPPFDLHGTTLYYADPAASAMKRVTAELLFTSWGTPEVMASVQVDPGAVDAFPADGGVTISWGVGMGSILPAFFTGTAPAPGGVLQAAPVASGLNGALRMVPGSVPGAVFSDLRGMKYVEAGTADGTSWGAPHPFEGPAGSPRPAAVRLADGTVLAAFHLSDGSGQLRVSGTLAPSTAAWQAANQTPLMAAGVADGAITRSSMASSFFGREVIIAGENSMAFGQSSVVLGEGSFAAGIGARSTSFSSISLGNSTLASGSAATAMGRGSVASGEAATSMGKSTVASGDFSTAMGINSRAETYGEISLGLFPRANTGDTNSRVSTDVLLEVGNGTSAAASSNALTIFKDGRIGLGDADTTAEATYLLTLPNVASITGGQARANAWTTYSDSRIKTGQRPISYGLADIMRLQPRAYTQHSGCVENGTFKCEDKDGGTSETIGFIAQEVEQVIPEAVQKPADPANQLYGMDYQKLVPVLVKATQELKTENDALKAQLKAMDARLQKLERPARKR